MVRRSAQSRSKFTRDTRRRIKAQFPNAFHLRPFWGADGMLNLSIDLNTERPSFEGLLQKVLQAAKRAARGEASSSISGASPGGSGGGGGSGHAEIHELADTSGLGADHTVAGLTPGQVLQATAADAAKFQTLILDDLAVTAAKLAAPLAALIQGTPTITVGAEVADVINVAVQLKDVDGTNLAAEHLCTVWLSDAPKGTWGTPPDSLAVGTNGIIQFQPKDAVPWYMISSNATGQFDLDIGWNEEGTFYLNLEYGGKIFASAAITFI